MSGHEWVICPHGNVIRQCRCINADRHTRVRACPTPERHAGRPVTAGWTADGLHRTAAVANPFPLVGHNHPLDGASHPVTCYTCQVWLDTCLDDIEAERREQLKQREGDQPLPVVNDAPDIQSQVIVDIEERRQVGISRYGTALQPHNGRDALRDAYEEAIDLAMYLKQLIVERGSASPTPTGPEYGEPMSPAF